jgi:voltage-gated potassium channel Kch
MKYQPGRHNNFIWLLAALVALLFAGSLFAQLELRGAETLVNLSLMLTVIIAVWAMHEIRGGWLHPRNLVPAIVIAIMITDSAIESDVLAVAQLFFMFSFFAATIHMAWRQVMFTGQITPNTIYGAVCIYILIGLLFGFAFLLVEYLFPGSMNGLKSGPWQRNLDDLIYYSMITLTTVGYGDITPAAPLTRFLAYMESGIGIFYTTILVASLIGMRLSAQQPRNSG